MLHKDAVVGDIHKIQNWAVADEAERLALTVIEADEGKVCLQLDTPDFFILLDHSVPTWAPWTGPIGPQGVQGDQGIQGPQGVPGPEVIIVAASDEATTLTAGTSYVTFRMPFAMTLTSVRASLTTASTSGAVTVDINEGGATLLSTKLTIDQDEKTSTTAATPAVISDSALADDAEISIDVDGAGTGATGLKITLIGTRV
jgi:hypothetical protein